MDTSRPEDEDVCTARVLTDLLSGVAPGAEVCILRGNELFSVTGYSIVECNGEQMFVLAMEGNDLAQLLLLSSQSETVN